MKKNQLDWRAKAHNHLTKLDSQCSMKKRGADGKYVAFGIVFHDERNIVYIRDPKKGNVTMEKEEFADVNAMLDAGWDVD